MKYFSIALMAFMLTGCQQIIDTSANMQYGDDFSGFNLFYGDFSAIDSLWDIPYWMDKYVTFKETTEVLSPKEVMKRGFGDCDGYALLFMNIAYVRFGIKPSLCLVDYSRAIVDGGYVNHAIVKVNGKYYHAQSGQKYTGSIGYEYSFDHVFEY